MKVPSIFQAIPRVPKLWLHNLNEKISFLIAKIVAIMSIDKIEEVKTFW